MNTNELAQGVRAVLKEYGVTENSEATLAVMEYIQGKDNLPEHTWINCPSYECPIVSHQMPTAYMEPNTRVRFVGEYLASLVGGFGTYLGMHGDYHMVRWDWNQDGRITLNTDEEFVKVECICYSHADPRCDLHGC